MPMRETKGSPMNAREYCVAMLPSTKNTPPAIAKPTEGPLFWDICTVKFGVSGVELPIWPRVRAKIMATR